MFEHRQKVDVSIRAPAWRATLIGRRVAQMLVFQSAPPHGGRLLRRSKTFVSVGFNPRPRMEGDTPRSVEGAAAPFVSIRAPAWRATGRVFPGH